MKTGMRIKWPHRRWSSPWLAFTGALLVLAAVPGATSGQGGSPAGPGLQDGAARVSSVQSAATKLGGQVRELEREIASLPEAREEAARLAGEKVAKQQELDRLAFKVENLNDALRETEGQSIAEALDALEQKSRELQKRLDELRREKLAREADLASTLEAASSNRTFRADVGKVRWSRKRSRNIALIGNRAVPIEEPYYTFEWATTERDGRSVRYVKKATRVQEGDTIKAALRDGASVARILRECSRRSDYIKLFVCPDAISAFRHVVRDAKRHGVDFFWIPHVDGPLRGSASGKGLAPTM